jgi:hypothetical protein
LTDFFEPRLKTAPLPVQSENQKLRFCYNPKKFERNRLSAGTGRFCFYPAGRRPPAAAIFGPEIESWQFSGLKTARPEILQANNHISISLELIVLNLSPNKSLLTGKLVLWFLAIFISMSLSEAENSIFDIRLFTSNDQINHFKLAQSSQIQLLNGQLPIRTAENIDDSLGNPYHQFYSPAVHFLMAVFSIIFMDLIFGSSVLFVLLLALGFIYSYKISLYITKSPLYSYINAFIFAACPYLAAIRISHGALAEYFAFCISPVFVYYFLRSQAGKNFSHIIPCILSLSVLILVHLITCFYLMFFISIYFVFYLINLFIQYKFNNLKNLNKHLKVFIRRISKFIVINIISLAVTSFFIIPVIISNDLYIKYFPYDAYFSFSASCTNLLSLFSIKPSLNIIKLKTCSGSYQVGFIVFLGFIYSIAVFWKRKNSLFLLPLIGTILVILAIIINPGFFTLFPFISLAQFSTRFLLDFQIIVSILFILAVKDFCTRFKLSYVNKIIFSLTVIITSLMLVIPHLKPMTIQPDFPKRMNANDIKNADFSLYGKYNFYKFLIDLSQFNMDNIQIILNPTETSNSQHKKFIADLAVLAEDDSYRGNIAFYVLYYPSLMKVTAKIDNIPFTPDADTFWYKTPELEDHEELVNVGVHALRLNNLPAQGILEVETEFTGSPLGNYISLISLALLIGLGLAGKIRRCLQKAPKSRTARSQDGSLAA